MTELKEKHDPILSRSVMPNKSDMMMFKNETLRDFKDAQKKFSEKYKNLEFEIKEKLQSYEQRIVTYEQKIIELSNLINTDKTIRDKVDKLMEFKEKADDTMLTEKIRLDNFRNDLNSNVERIDQILKDSVIYPGVVGGISKYKTFHDLIDYVLTQTSQNLTFREKSILDFKSYKTKLENIISSFNTQINTLLNTTSEYTKTCVKALEDKTKSIFEVYDDRLQDTRIENANYAIGLEKATEALKKELENLEVIKKELYEKVDNGILEVKNDNTRVTKLFSGYKKNFHIMQHKFTQLSDFIKDIRFRINLKEDVNRREYSHMSDLINFDKKKKEGFYDGVYSHNTIKKGLASQLKDYIEGRITADQLFKKKGENSKSMGKINENKNFEANKRRSLTGLNNEENEEMKLNFFDLLKNNISKRMSLEPQELKNINNKNELIIKEEDEINNNISEEVNPMFYKTLKEKNSNKNILEQEPEKLKEEKKIDRSKIIDKNKSMDSKSIEKNKSTDKKENIIKITKEDSKIQIVSKNKENENQKNNNIDISEKKNERASIKNVINDLFNVKNIMNNIKNAKNESNSNNKSTNQNDKKNENSKNNDAFNNLFNEKKVEQNKIKPQNKSYNNRAATALNIKNNEKNFFNNKNRLNSGNDNKKYGNQEPKSVSINIYNATMNSFGQVIPTINYKQNNNNKKKSNSSNQKNTKFYLKQNTSNPSYKSNIGPKKEDTNPLENILNNLNNYIPQNDLNIDETNYISLKKKK